MVSYLMGDVMFSAPLCEFVWLSVHFECEKSSAALHSIFSPLSLLRWFDQECHSRPDRLSWFSQQLQQQPDLPLGAGGPWGPENTHSLWEGGAGWGRWSVSRTISFYMRMVGHYKHKTNVLNLPWICIFFELWSFNFSVSSCTWIKFVQAA